MNIEVKKLFDDKLDDEKFEPETLSLDAAKSLALACLDYIELTTVKKEKLDLLSLAEGALRFSAAISKLPEEKAQRQQALEDANNIRAYRQIIMSGELQTP